MPHPNKGKTQSPTQDKMMAMLSDGLAHSKEELHQCLDDDLASLAAVDHHILLLRKKVERDGLLIAFRNGYYALVRSASSPYDGRS